MDRVIDDLVEDGVISAFEALRFLDTPNQPIGRVYDERPAKKKLKTSRRHKRRYQPR